MNLIAQLSAHGLGTPGVVEANPAWPAVAAELIAQLPAEIAWEHVGSTAVPGLAGAATLDLLGVAPSAAAIAEATPVLVALGFALQDDCGVPGRTLFRIEAGTADLVSLHVVVAGSPVAKMMRSFRDHLRANEADRARYEAFKRSAPQVHEGDVPGKGALIESMIPR